MNKKSTCLFLPVLILLAAAFFTGAMQPASAQAQPANTSLRSIMGFVDSFNAKLPSEKLYLHFDKPYYAVGDTIWFKAYLFQAASHLWSPLSGIIYVELISDSDKVIKRMSFPAAYGISWGQIPLLPDEVGSGRYTIYAYTNWMQNAGPACFFHQQFAIGESADRYWLVRETHRVTGGDVSLAVQLTGADAKPEKLKNIRVKVTDGKKTLYHDDLTTGTDGSFRTTFTLPAKAGTGGIVLVAEDKTDPAHRVIVPIAVNRPGNIDLQFMPESGYLVAGLPSRVGFKAIGENGKGADVHGKIIDSHNKEILSFSSIHKGMGAFDFVPDAGETYTAVVAAPGGAPLRYPLPEVKNSGTVLQVRDEGDSLHLSILYTPDLLGGAYHLLGLARGLVCYGANFKFDKRGVGGRVSKTVFPSGIAHFTVFNNQLQPVNERMVFINQQDNLAIDISNDKTEYGVKDSVSLHVQVTDKQQQPVAGSFSISVTDDAQVKPDSVRTENILSRLLLSAELKGTIEDPAWYLLHPSDPETVNALDALMLTQGWTGYNWQNMFKKLPAPLFTPEPAFMVTGKVVNLFNKPLEKADVLMMSTGKKGVLRDTVTGADGRFVFYNFPIADTPMFLIQARNAKGRNFGIGLTVDEFKPAEIKQEAGGLIMPWYVNGDSALLSYVRNNYQRQQDLLTGGGRYKLLQEVTVNGRKVVKGSFNLNGPGQADQVIDEAEIARAGKLNLKMLLQQTVKGFRIVYGANGSESYRIFSDYLDIVIDGVPLARFGQQRETLEYLQASDIKGIELMHSARNTAAYRTTFLGINQQMNINREYSFVEITTYSGNGAFMKKVPGVYVYKPLPITWPVQFYSPRYVVKDDAGGPQDLRSTIYWQPNLVTDKNGGASTSFYTAGKPSTYTVVLQGSDMNGNIGFTMKKIVVTGGQQ